jgi:hypothetical protein
MIHVKINNSVQVIYQAPKAQTGLTVTMEIIDETGAKDIVNFPDVTMVETPAASGRYVGTFTPDALGVWRVDVAHTSGKNPVTLSYNVHQYNQDDAAEVDPPIIV